MSEFKLRIYSANYDFLGELADYLWLKCEREVNAAGLLQVEMLAEHPALSLLEYRSVIELWRRNTRYGIPWYRESVNLYLGMAASNRGADVVRLYCPGPLWLLSTRVVAWREETDGKTVWNDRVDAIGRGLVQQNAGEGATAAAGRLRDGMIPGISVEDVVASGEVIDWVTGTGDLLAELRSLADAVGDDFSLDLIASPFGWLFRWYTAQLGTDRTATVAFRLELGTMSEPVYLLDQRAEKTVCIVGGPDLVGGREYSVAIGSAFSAEHDVEDFVIAPAGNTDVKRLAAGSARLGKEEIIERLSFQVKQMPGLVYGRDYFLGDRVKAKYLDYELTPKVAAVTLQQEWNGEEKVEVACKTR